MLEKSCYEFIQETASKSPVPGGGSTSAVVGSIGTALASMVGNLTVGKKKYAEVEDEVKELISESEILIDELNKWAEKDAEAFIPLANAYKMPTSTQEEKDQKKKAMQDALINAVIVPFEIAKCCGKAIDIHNKMKDLGNPIAISDIGVGVIFCKAALQGAKLNILINTGIMDNSILRDSVLREIKELEKEYIAKADKIFNEVEEQLKN